MGGYLSGGHNKKHGCTAGHIRLDSFMFIKYMDGAEHDGVIEWGNGNKTRFAINQDYMELNYFIEKDKRHITETISLDTEPNNYGGNRLYFECPHCFCSNRYLYLHGGLFKCRKCAGLNYPSQQITKNEDLTVYQMNKLLRDKFKISKTLSPLEMSVFMPPRPKGMHESTYKDLLMRFNRLQCKYNQQFAAKVTKLTTGL